MNALHLTTHERREIARDTVGFWMPFAILVLRAIRLRRQEARESAARRP